MKARVDYTPRELVHGIIRDLIVDARCAERNGLHDYAAHLKLQIRAIFPHRHDAKLDRYGWPIVLYMLDNHAATGVLPTPR